MKKLYASLVLVLVVFVAIIGGIVFAAQKYVNAKVSRAVAAATQSENAKIAKLQNAQANTVAQIEKDFTSASASQASSTLSTAEIASRSAIIVNAQQDSLTQAVAKVAPAVVSVVISKDVPQYQVTYENPFGDDPFFQNVGIQVPVYTPTGSTTSQTIGAGSGFLITSNGYILTNKHVVYDDTATYTVLLSTGKQLVASVVYKDPQNDLAVIKIDATGLPFVTLGNSDDLVLGQTVAAIGNALGQYSNSVSTGVVSGLNRTITAQSEDGTDETLSGVIQTDAAINPGNSGGPLLDLDGDVVGINVATIQGSSNVSFSIPINEVKQIIATVVPH